MGKSNSPVIRPTSLERDEKLCMIAPCMSLDVPISILKAQLTWVHALIFYLHNLLCSKIFFLQR